MASVFAHGHTRINSSVVFFASGDAPANLMSSVLATIKFKSSGLELGAGDVL